MLGCLLLSLLAACGNVPVEDGGAEETWIQPGVPYRVVSIGIPLATSTGWEVVPLERLTPERFQQAVEAVSGLSSEELQVRFDLPESVLAQEGSLQGAKLYQLTGNEPAWYSAGHRRARSRKVNGQYVFPTGRGGVGAGHTTVIFGWRDYDSPGVATVTYEWTAPTQAPKMVSFIPVHDWNQGLVVNDPTITLTYQMERFADAQQSWQYRIMLGSTVLMETSVTPSGPQSANALSTVFAFRHPVFEADFSGEFHMNVSLAGNAVPGQPESAVFTDETYLQRDLRLEEPFPVLGPDDGPVVSLQNRMIWDAGDSTVRPEDDPKWTFSLTDPDGGTLFSTSGETADVSVEFDLDQVLLDDVTPRSFRILPDALLKTQPDEVLTQAQDDGVVVLGYRFSGSAIAYPEEFNAINFTNGLRIPRLPEVRHTVTEAGTISSRDLVILNEDVTPNPFFPSDEEPEAKLTAQVVPVGPDWGSAPDIEWTVSLVDEEGTVIWPELASGSGPFVSAVWDGTDVNGDPIDPQTVHFRIQAQGCPGGDEEPPPPAFRGEELLFQGDRCPRTVADILLALRMDALISLRWQQNEIPPSNVIISAPIFKESPPSFTSAIVEYLGTSPLTLELEVAAERDSGGHVEDGHDGIRPHGVLGSEGDKTVITFESSGAKSVQYKAPIVGGRYTLSGRVLEGPENTVVLDAASVLTVAVPDLVELSPALNLFGVAEPTFVDRVGATDKHPFAHYGDAGLQVRLALLAYHHYREKSEDPTFVDKRLWINDTSLEHGGVFDLNGLYNNLGSHVGHGAGREADVNNELVHQGNLDPLLEERAKLLGLSVHNEVGSEKSPHYHLQLPHEGGAADLVLPFLSPLEQVTGAPTPDFLPKVGEP